MPVRTFAIGLAVLCFVLASVLIFATISAVRRRRIVALVFRGILALCLLGIVAAQLPTIFGPTPGPKSFFKQPAPVSNDAVVNYSTSAYNGLIARTGGKGGGLYLSALDNITLVGIRAQNGKLRWQRSLPLNNALTYVVADGMIYLSATVAGHSQLYALRAADGSTLWQTTYTQEFLRTAPVISEGLIFFGTQAPQSATNTSSSQLVALRTSDGAQVWSVPVERIRPNTLRVQSGVLDYVLKEDGG